MLPFKHTVLPWSDAPVRAIKNLKPYFAGTLPAGAGRYLPDSITLFIDPEISDVAIESFLAGMSRQLEREILVRGLRRDHFADLGLMEACEMEKFLTGRTGIQPWALYFSTRGGLGLPPGRAADLSDDRGVIPCSSMLNHGVAWNRARAGGTHTWLATARKENADWDWDSDIGHESAHAAFAQIPLFAQAVHRSADDLRLSAGGSATDLTAGHLARICYMYSEVAVVAMRNEERPTETNLPIPDRAELLALLNLSDQLMPKTGFDRAITACERVNGSIGLDSTAIYEIAAPVLRIVPYVTRLGTSGTAPDVGWFQRVRAAAI